MTHVKRHLGGMRLHLTTTKYDGSTSHHYDVGFEPWSVILADNKVWESELKQLVDDSSVKTITILEVGKCDKEQLCSLIESKHIDKIEMR